MPEFGSISRFLALARRGDSAATGALVGRYFGRLAAIARRQLRHNRAKRREVDEEDVALDALNSVIMRIQDGHYPDIVDRDGLWRLLLRVAKRKVLNQARREHQLIRGVGKVRGDSAFGSPDESYRRSFDDFESVEPMPEEADQILSILDEFLGETDGDLRQVALMRLQGHTVAEMMAKLSLSRSAVERKIRVLQSALREKLTE